MEEDPYDMGWRHGTEDIGSMWRFRPTRPLSPDDYDEYKEGYREARFDYGS